MVFVVHFLRHSNEFELAEDAKQFANFFDVRLKRNVPHEDFTGLLLFFHLTFALRCFGRLSTGKMLD